jgi:exo-beta-1,3-glucanase (GH17 family)
MKFFAPIVVGVIAFFSAQVDANGVCYDPDHSSGKSATTVQADMEAIAGAGFSSVRTYISKFGNTEMGPIITGAGLTAVLGVPYPQSDYLEQMEAAISAANSGGVYAIMVGNENLAGASSVPSGMIDVINQIKGRVSVKVGTVQRNTEVIGYKSISGWSDLVSACDVLGVNVHPFFNPGTTADGAIDVVDTQWQTMMSNFGDKLLLTETGWPSSGSVSGNTGSLSGEQTFYSAYQQWSSGLSEKFYFQFFDTPSKSESYEQTFGLYTSDAQSKFTMSQQQSTSTTTSTTQQQTTSAPMTSAPTTEAPSTSKPTTEAPTQAPTTEASTEAPTATPTPTSETYQSSASSETTSASSETTSASSETNTTSSSESAGSSVQQGLASLSSSSDVEVSSSSESSTSSSTTQEERSASSKSKQNSETSEFTQSTAAVSSIGKSTESQQEQQTSSTGDDSTQQANTQSEASSSGGVVGLAVGGGACAMLVAFGFIYQARKRAQEMEADEKELDQHFSTITPVENICAL